MTHERTQFFGPDDPRIADAVVRRTRELSRDELAARLQWMPEGAEEEGDSPEEPSRQPAGTDTVPKRLGGEAVRRPKPFRAREKAAS